MFDYSVLQMHGNKTTLTTVCVQYWKVGKPVCRQDIVGVQQSLQSGPARIHSTAIFALFALILVVWSMFPRENNIIPHFYL